MYKSCSRCGKIHDYNKKCYVGYSNRKKDTNANRFRKTTEWTNKSIEIRELSKYLCAICLDKGIYNYDKLEVHHIIPLEEDIDRGLDNDNLICLCNSHHREAEKGEIDREYLFKLVRDRNI